MISRRLLPNALMLPLLLLSTACMADYNQGYAPNYPPGYDNGQGSGQFQQPGDLFGGQDVASMDVFTEPLSRYGRWVNSRYGRAFQPQAGQDYRPYVNGYWGEDRLWISNDPWGWATDHYGRWGFDEDFGWVWAPGRQWAPSWVAWRENGGQGGLRGDGLGGDGFGQNGVGQGVVGWAPIPPGVNYSIGVGFGSGFGFNNFNSWYAPSWVWVPRNYLYQRGFGGRVLPWNSGRNFWNGSRWNYNSGWNGRPGYSRPGGWGPRQGFGQPGFGQPGFRQPGFGQPGFGQLGFGQPGFRQPGFRQPGFRQPGFRQPGNRDRNGDGIPDGRFSNGEADRLRNGNRDGRFDNGQRGGAGFIPGGAPDGEDPGRNFGQNPDGSINPGNADRRRGNFDRQNRRAERQGLPQVYSGVTPAPAPGAGAPAVGNQPNPQRFRGGNRVDGGNPARGNPAPNAGGDGGRRVDGGGGGGRAMNSPPVQTFTPPPAQAKPQPQRAESEQPQRAESERPQRAESERPQRAENRRPNGGTRSRGSGENEQPD
jgi:hypothetical protein